MFSKGRPNISKEEIEQCISQADILGYYLNVKKIPCVINSPLRADRHPSFALYSPNGKDVNYKDFATGESGNCYKLLMNLWHKPYCEVLKIIEETFVKKSKKYNKIDMVQSERTKKVEIRKDTVELQCKIRDWQPHDIEYWNSYGVRLDVLKYCDVYPISHKIINKDGKSMVFLADKYAYAFVERKEGHTTYKFYQPFNKNGYKWQNNHDKSVLGLWSKMPEKGKDVCICSSVKDALCLMSNINITCICLQGEGYPISCTAKQELMRRFKNVFICLDNDETGVRDAFKLQSDTGFINVELPKFEGGKDISDYYKCIGKEKFIENILNLFKEAREEWLNTLPF